MLSSEDGTFGVYPTAFFETGLGLNIGAHLVDRDVAGHDEHLSLSAGYGGELNQRYDASFATGSLLGATVATARASFRAWDLYNYYGVGNATAAVQTHFAQRVWHGELVGKRAITDSVIATEALVRQSS